MLEMDRFYDSRRTVMHTMCDDARWKTQRQSNFKVLSIAIFVCFLLTYGVQYSTGSRISRSTKKTSESFESVIETAKFPRKRREALDYDASYLPDLSTGERKDDESFGFPLFGAENYDDYGDENQSPGTDVLDILYKLYKGPVCSLIDVRNRPDNLRDMENCVVINGFVQILFMHNTTEKDFENYTFPKLRVITQYLLIFRVEGLRSLRHMFPNLAMIEGRRVFYDYAMVIYENPHLTELGLENLSHIRRGGVRIQKNNQLCFLSSVDWQKLGQLGNTRNRDIDNSKIINNQADEGDVCPNQCGKDCSIVNSHTGLSSQHCWGVNACQKKSCPKECPNACRDGNKCDCHEECLLGCSVANSAANCTYCKHKYSNQTGTCVKKCAEDEVLMEGWYCIAKSWCSTLGWVIHNSECLNRCPSGFTDVKTEEKLYMCVTCEEDICRKACGKTTDVYKVSDNSDNFQHVVGCTEILGRLEISVKGGVDVVRKMGEDLIDLKSVGALVIQRSTALASLEILKNLRNITGHKDALKDGTYSLYVLNNKNLKYLWDFDEKRSNENSDNRSRRKKPRPGRRNKHSDNQLTIGGGKAFFHFNSQLCLKEIKKLSDLTAEVEDNTDISEYTNGDRASCDVMNIKILSIDGLADDSNGARQNITWEQIKIDDKRNLLAYQLYYKESPIKTATKFEGVYACGVSSWEIRDVLVIGENEKSLDTMSLELTHLKPYTQYAMYISAYTTLSANRGAQSNITYFLTQPTAPSEPRDVLARAVNHSSIEVEWLAPKHTNGYITHYKVRWRRQDEYVEPALTLDTCVAGFDHNRQIIQTQQNTNELDIFKEETTEVKIDEASLPKGCCACKGRDITILEESAEDSRRFEDLLHARMFGSRSDTEDITLSRKRRNTESSSLGEIFPTASSSSLLTRYSAGVLMNETTTSSSQHSFSTKAFPWHSTTVKGTKITITGLHHFSEYDIQVLACNHAANHTKYNARNQPYVIGCSFETLTSKRTSRLPKADIIPILSFFSTREEKEVEVNGKKIKKIYNVLEWEPPIDPNGYVKFYLIEYTLVDKKGEDKSKTEQKCFSVRDFKANNRRYKIPDDLSPGVYNARVKPVTIADEGEWTAVVEFEVEAPPSVDTWVQNVAIVIVILAVILVAAVLISVQCIFKKRRETIARNAITAVSVNPEYAQLFVPDGYEVEADTIELVKQIGHGNFGKVYEGLAKCIIRDEPLTKVAIKKLHEDASIPRRIEFLQEADIMKTFNSHHVVRLLGVVSQTTEPMVVMELMMRGDLKSHLRSRREGAEDNTFGLPPPTLQEKLQMAAQIADGMAYLAANKFVHRDLAARNCLVHESGVVKIGDFGLTRDIYATDYYRKDNKGFLPIRWMAPESLKDGMFDTASDVWSFGVVLWEISTLAEQPYQGRAHDQVTRFVVDGGYMERPSSCPKRLYDMMLVCWEYRPSLRPTFIEIIESLLNDVSENFKNNCFYYEQKAKDEKAEKAEEIAVMLLHRGGSVHSSHHSYKQPHSSSHTPSSRHSNCSTKNIRGNESEFEMRRTDSQKNKRLKHPTEDNYYTVKSSDSENSLSEAKKSSEASSSHSPRTSKASSHVVEDDDDCYASLSYNQNGTDMAATPDEISKQPLIPNSGDNTAKPYTKKQPEQNGYHYLPNNKDSKYFESIPKAPSPPLISPPPLTRQTYS